MALVPMAMAANGSYNSFTKQVGFCKNQGFDTVSQSTSGGPPVFLDGSVLVGVGLSNVEFQDSTASCGRCIEVTTIQNFWTFDKELTTWAYETPWPSNQTFVAMVMDRCTDPVCTSGYLDFDVYNEIQPTKHGNPRGIEWTFVPCPISTEPIELLLCLGPHTCQEHFEEGRTWQEVLEDAVATAYFSVYVRNARVAVSNVGMRVDEMTVVELRDEQGWQFSGADYASALKCAWVFELKSIEGVHRTATVSWTDLDMDQMTSAGYRGGVLIRTSIQV